MGIKRGHVPYRNSTLTTVLRDRRAAGTPHLRVCVFG